MHPANPKCIHLLYFFESEQDKLWNFIQFLFFKFLFLFDKTVWNLVKVKE